MRSIRDIETTGRRVLVRVDFNVPMDEARNITDAIRLRTALPTLRHIIDQGGKLILCSHLGRPKGNRIEEFSLDQVAKALGKMLNRDVKLAPDCIGEEVEQLVANMHGGDVLLLENLRFHAGETANDPDFSRKLAALADIYINDAFAVSHRAHASVVGVAEHIATKGMGFQLETELDYFSKAMEEPVRPLVALVGGAKVSSKLGALQNMLEKVDSMIIGGAMANTFLKSMNIDVGASKTEDDLLDTARQFIQEAEGAGVKLYFPVDFIVAGTFSVEAVAKTVTYQNIPKNWMALDIGPASALYFQEVIAEAGTIVWNGPMGAFEIDAFARGTMAICRAVGAAHGLSITGGGDSNAAVLKSGESKNISYMSTGGGAFLTLMEGKNLPGVDALRE